MRQTYGYNCPSVQHRRGSACRFSSQSAHDISKCCDRIQGQDIPITNIEVDMINETINQVPKKELRYDFYNDEIIEKESMIKPFVIIPQNGLRYSIINIIAYICGNLVNEYMVISID